MAKRSSLFGSTPAAKPVDTTPPAAEPARSEQARSYPVATTRQGKRAATCYLDPAALSQLKMIAIQEDTTVQDLLVEGINAVFEKRGRGRIA